jgi:hypothetical protein
MMLVPVIPIEHRNRTGDLKNPCEVISLRERSYLKLRVCEPLLTGQDKLG